MTRKKVIAYCFTKNLKKMTEEDIRALDAVHIAFGLIENGEVVWKGKNAKRQLDRIRKIHPEIRLVLSVGGWGADGFSQAAMTQKGREILTDSALRLVEEYGFDGLDIDWEYPGIGIGGIACDKQDKENYTLLLAQLRKGLDTFDTSKTLSCAAGGEEYFLQSVNIKEAAQYLDFIQLMNYDLRGGFQVITGHHANLYSYHGDLSLSSTDRIVQLLAKEGIPLSKLVVGVAFYGRRWKGVKDSGNANGLFRVARTTGSDIVNYEEAQRLCKEKNSKYKKFWDEEAQAAWLFDGSSFISYEDERAIECKGRYVKENDLYGVMYWEYALDSGHTLTQLLRSSVDGDFG